MTKISDLAANKSVVVCCGSGGVGKTTSAAALAVHAAELGRRACVVTIDPARRLADALGLGELTNEPRQVDGPGFPPRREVRLRAPHEIADVVEGDPIARDLGPRGPGNLGRPVAVVARRQRRVPAGHADDWQQRGDQRAPPPGPGGPAHPRGSRTSFAALVGSVSPSPNAGHQRATGQAPQAGLRA